MVWIYSVFLIAGALCWTALGAVFPASLAVVPFVERCRRRQVVCALGLSAACFCYGLLSSISFQHQFERMRDRSGHPATRVVTLDGWVCGFPEQRLGGVRFPLETTVDGERMRFLSSAVAFDVGYGDSVRATGRLSIGRPERWRGLQSRGACGYLRVGAGRLQLLESAAAGATPRRWAWRVHEWARCRLAIHLGSRCGLPTALSVGERGWIGKGLKTVVSQLGVSHLLALSGMHLGLIAGAVLAIFRLALVRSRMLLLLVLTVYVAIVGDVVSLYRAYAMAVVLILAVELERPTQPLRALGTALFVLLLANPGLTYSVAFQLSFVATLAVLLCVTKMGFSLGSGWKRRIGSGVASTLVVSVCVQVFLLPIQLRYFGGVSVMTPVTTLVFLPVVALIVFLSGVSLAADWIAAPLSAPLFAALGWVATGFERVLFLTAARAPGLVELPQPSLFVYYAGQSIVWFGPGKGRKAVAVRGAIGVFVCLLAFAL